MQEENSPNLSDAQINIRQNQRKQMWSQLMAVSRPDSRFHWDFSSFIPDFVGSEDCAQQLLDLPGFRDGGELFITPDNSTEATRVLAIQIGRPFTMTTYGIGRGFLRLDPRMVPLGEARYAATLDGMDRYAEPVSLAKMAAGPRFSMLVTGGSAVSRNGVRFGKGHGYFDLEWALLSEIGTTDEDTQIADIVHDCQVVDQDLVGADHDVPVDWIVTPTRTLHIQDTGRQAGRVRWELLDHSPLASIPPVRELRERKNDAGRDHPPDDNTRNEV